MGHGLRKLQFITVGKVVCVYRGHYSWHRLAEEAECFRFEPKEGMSFKAHSSDLLLLARSHLPNLHSNQGMKLVKCADIRALQSQTIILPINHSRKFQCSNVLEPKEPILTKVSKQNSFRKQVDGIQEGKNWKQHKLSIESTASCIQQVWNLSKVVLSEILL